MGGGKPCYEIRKISWKVLKDIPPMLSKDAPLLPTILDVYPKQDIKGGHPMNRIDEGAVFKTEQGTAYPYAHWGVTKETMTVEKRLCIMNGRTLTGRLSKLKFSLDEFFDLKIEYL